MFPKPDIFRHNSMRRPQTTEQGSSLPGRARRTQCRMLHLWWVIGIVFMQSGVSLARESTDPKTLDVISNAELKTLQPLIAGRVAHIERRRSRKGSLVYPGGFLTTGQGWQLSRIDVLTASVIVEGWTPSAEDALSVTIGGTTYAATVRRLDTRKGLAVLRLEIAPSSTTVYPEWLAPSDRELWPGRPLFSSGPGAHARRYAVIGPGVGAFSYYLLAAGGLPLGAPLTDAKGRLITIVGMRHYEKPGLMHLLPAESMRWVTQPAEAE